MDENKINPTPMDEQEDQPQDVSANASQDENQDIEAVVENEAITALADDESEVETAETFEAEQSDDADAETDVPDESAEDNEDTSDTEVVQDSEVQPKKKKSKGAIAALVILIGLLIAAIAVFVMFVFDSTSPKIDYDEIAVTVGDVDITVGEYMYWYAYVDAYYYNYYSYYYSQISEDQIKADTLNQLTHTSALYSEAVKAGYTLSEEEIAQLDSSMQGYEEAAEMASMDIDEFIGDSFGKGFTAEMLRSYLEKQAIAYKYYEDMMALIDEGYVGDAAQSKIETAYNANKKAYDLSDVSYFYFDATDDSSQGNADSIIKKVKEGTAFDEAIKAVTGDSAAISNKLVGYDSETISGNFNEDAAKWIFEVDANGEYVNTAGSSTLIDAGSVIYVLYVNEAPHRDESIPVTIDYIQVDISTDDTVKTADELDLQAKSTANKILSEFEGTDKTAEAFALLVAEYDNGDDALVSGDAYEDMKKDGSHDAAIEEWAFDQGRKIGDYAIVKSDGSYFILFYREQAEKPVWYQAVYSSLLQAEKTEWDSEFMASYEGSVVTNDEAIDASIAFIKEKMAA